MTTGRINQVPVLCRSRGGAFAHTTPRRPFPWSCVRAFLKEHASDRPRSSAHPLPPLGSRGAYLVTRWLLCSSVRFLCLWRMMRPQHPAHPASCLPSASTSTAPHRRNPSVPQAYHRARQYPRPLVPCGRLAVCSLEGFPSAPPTAGVSTSGHSFFATPIRTSFCVLLWGGRLEGGVRPSPLPRPTSSALYTGARPMCPSLGRVWYGAATVGLSAPGTPQLPGLPEHDVDYDNRQ